MGGAGSPGERWPFVARDAEVAALDDLLLSGRGAVLVGDAGIGKSRLLSAAADHAAVLGWRVHRVAGSRALASVPFGAFAATLRTSVSQHSGDRFAILQAALAEMGSGDAAPVLLTIDDAHELDDGGATLANLAARSGFLVVACVRRGARCPDSITALWKDDIASRVEIAPLDGSGIASVLRATLGAPVDGGTRLRLMERTNGNLLFLRELVRVGLARGLLVERGEVWVWDGPMSEAPAVADLVQARLASLDPSEREVVDVVALGEPIGIGLLHELCDVGAVRSCEAKGILVTQRAGRRLEVRLEHPLYADVVRDAMHPTVSAHLAITLGNALLASGLRRVGDRLRAATLLVMASSPVGLELLLEASDEARSLADLEVAERLGRAAVDQHGGATATVDLAETLLWRGVFREVVDLISSPAMEHAASDEKARGAMWAAQSSFYGLGDLSAAERWIASGVDAGGPVWASRLRGKHSQMLMNAGRAQDAIVEGQAVLADPLAATDARAAAYSGLLPALAVSGRLTELDEHLAAAQALIDDAAPGFVDAVDGTLVGMFIGGLFAGRLPEIDPIFEAFDEDALRRVDDPFRCIWVFLRGRSALGQGRLGVALPTLREDAAVLRRRDPGGMLGWCLASLAQACGATGDARGARAAMAELDEVHFSVMRNIDVEIGLGRAWAAAAAGERSAAIALALDTANGILERGDAAVGVFALHDAVRLGADPRVAATRSEAAAQAEGPVVAAMTNHMRALAADDLEALGQTVDEFAAVSMPLLAAEAAASAARVAAENGLRARRAALAARASAFLVDCGPALTPMLEVLVGREALELLTRREQEVALMAARGTSKRAMSEQLGVSIRTVGNHINHVYGKLGISTRDELAALLSLDPSS
ncbi:MAG TPA: LuxR C-terminal-related transcriptional regulator [Acidimicrobiales bacterium]|nr:LuxR C-terminal-related transcriptional regulator [Acidimicrobiales bacterium]